MTAREWYDDVPLKVVVLIVGVTLAFAGLQAQVAMVQVSKADRTTVEQMAADLKDIRTILCEQASKDSMCHR